MCDFCAHILPNRDAHDQCSCPLRQAMYCSVCQIHGHTANTCPDVSAWQVRVPEFQEQLIPANVRQHYNIETQTPIVSPNPSPRNCEYTSVYEIIDRDPKSIRAALTSLGFSSKTECENKRTLEKVCQMTGKKLVYLQDERALAEKKQKGAKRTFTVKKAKTSAAESSATEGTSVLASS
jgi:hypothetical protein